nr:sigma factor-like helix-turn-helix DNA-binding protein [Mycobacterium sp. QGD 101]
MQHHEEAQEQPADILDPEQEALLADSVGVALLVILQTLSPAERLAFVLHDMFDLPFAEIAPIVGRSENSAAQLAARARRRVRGKHPDPATALVEQRRVVEAFLTAARDGDFDALLAVLHRDVVLHVDATLAGRPVTVRGARTVAGGAYRFAHRAVFAEPALVDGAVGIVVATNGRLSTVLRFRVAAGKITEVDIHADPDRLRRFELAMLG